MSFAAKLAENLAAIRQKIAAAAARARRSEHDIKLIAVTKYVDAGTAQLLLAAGCRDLGESRPQDLWTKAEAISDPAVRWHFIGHLQRNKVSRTLPRASLIHSGDSLRLLETIYREAAELKRRVPVLLEVNISGDATKHGFVPADVEPNLKTIAALSSLEIRGLMCMASREGDIAQARREFAQLRELRDQLSRNAPAEMKLDELSMGMSGDFEVAIEEGATMVRIGSALFEGIEPAP